MKKTMNNIKTAHFVVDTIRRIIVLSAFHHAKSGDSGFNFEGRKERGTRALPLRSLFFKKRSRSVSQCMPSASSQRTVHQSKRCQTWFIAGPHRAVSASWVSGSFSDFPLPSALQSAQTCKLFKSSLLPGWPRKPNLRFTENERYVPRRKYSSRDSFGSKPISTNATKLGNV